MEYKTLQDSQLAEIMVGYIHRSEILMKQISSYINNETCEYDNATIRNEYRSLKNEIREVAAYIRRSNNRNGSELYEGFFVGSISEAGAFGFGVSTNARINQQMYSAVEEARYRLTKYKSLENWKNLL